jgi:putative membrane protein
MSAAGGLALNLFVLPARAHEASSIDAFGAPWTFDPWVVTPLLATGLLYLVGTQRLWRRAGLGRGVRQWQGACFWGGWTALAVALVSPLHWLGERLFVAHMVEHTVVMAVGAPLIAVSRPIGAILWALPRWLRALFGRVALWDRVREPFTATAVQALALWIWHVPALYQLALIYPFAHRLQHVSFLVSGSLFWWALLYSRPRSRADGIAVICLFATAMQSGVLGALLTVSRKLWYPLQGSSASVWGLTALEDQQLAGLVMWVPMGLIYTAAALVFAARWINTSSSAHLFGRRYAALAR